MNSGPIDISSDEEPGRDELEDEDDFDWVSELMDSVDHANDDGSDEVVVIGEVNNKPKAKSSKRTVTDVDDDCVVLDGDPDKPISVVDDSGCGSDDLLVVGEKGQIACRDYPHPRNLCAKFPFRTTPHEKHCDLCHCYVCDSLAPCVHWGTGVSKIDHCHATDKEETWKAQRRDFKSVKSAPLSASKYSMALPKFSQVLPLDIIRLAPKPISQNQVSRPTTIRPCSSASRTMPGIRNPGRVHQSEYILSKNQAHAYSVSKQLLGAHNNVVGRNTSRVVSSPSMFKRVGAVGGSLPMNRTAFGSSQNSSCTSPSQYGRNSTPMAAANGRNPLRSQNVQSSVHQNSSQPMGTFIRNTVPSQPQTYIQPIPPSIYSPNFHQPGIQSQNSSQNISQYGNQSQNSSENICLQDIVGESVTDLGFSDCNHSWVNNSSQSVQQLPFQPPPIQQAPFQPPPIQPPPIQQPPFQQPPIQQPPIQQSPFQQPPVEHLQTQSSNPIYAPSPVKESSNELPNLSGLDSEFESWLLETQPVPAGTNDSVPSHLSLLSPEPTFIDTGMLMFDFETSWNGLTQV